MLPLSRKHKVEVATIADDARVCALARDSRYTRDFTSHRFYRDGIENTYAAGEVGIVQVDAHTPIKGFIYCKHLKRKPLSVVHFMAVNPLYKGKGVGKALLAWAQRTSPWGGNVELSCEHSNEDGIEFYYAVGCFAVGSGVYGTLPRVRPYTRFKLP